MGERFVAVDGLQLTKEQMQQKVQQRASWFCTPGMIGCFLSHRRAWERVCNESLDLAIVFEDDVRLFPDFAKSLQRLLDELPLDWDVCLIGAIGSVEVKRESFFNMIFALCTGG